MTTITNRLKPCPFCGGKAKETCYATLSYIQCEGKDCQTKKASWGPESTLPDGTKLNGLDGKYWCDVLYEKWNQRAK